MNHRIMIHGRDLPPKVKPGTKDVCPGDTVCWEARSTPAEVAFPRSRWPFVEPWDVIPVAEEVAGEAPKRFTFTVKGIKAQEDLGEFHYSVYCSRPGCYAVGDSDPIIIIRRPSGSGE